MSPLPFYFRLVSDNQVSFGKYQLIARLATGGMAEIFLARQMGIAGFEKLLVVKRILPHLAREKAFIQMFLDEARIAARLNHPNIVQIYDLGRVRDQYFIAMEYLEGESLASVMRHLRHRRRRLPPHLAAGIVLQVCEGLHYAHSMVGPDGEPLRVVHRDVNPQNIFVLYSGGVKLIDFGIAKAQNRFSHTSTGYLKGKYGYMSPEQIKNLPLDGRADVYSVGVVLWEMLTGRKLFRQASELEILKAITEQNPPAPSLINPDLPKEFDAITLRALHRSRDLRYQTAGELRMELSFLLKKSGEPSDSVALGEYLQLLFEQRMEEKRILIKQAQQKSAASLDQALFGDLQPYRSDTEPSISRDTPSFIGRTPAAADGPPTVVDSRPESTPTPGTPTAAAPAGGSRAAWAAMWISLLTLAIVAVAAVVLWQVASRNDRPTTGDNEPAPAREPVEDRRSNTTPLTVAPDSRPRPSPPTSSPADAGRPAAVKKPSRRRPARPAAATTKRPRRQTYRRQPGKDVPRPLHPPVSADKPGTGQPRGSGRLRLSTTPWTTIYLGERKLGPTPLVDIKLPAGRHRLRAVNPGKGIERTIEVEIKPDQTTVRVVRF